MIYTGVSIKTTANSVKVFLLSINFDVRTWSNRLCFCLLFVWC